MLNNKKTKFEQRFQKTYAATIWGGPDMKLVGDFANFANKNSATAMMERWAAEREELRRQYEKSVDEFMKIFDSFNIKYKELVSRGMYRVYETPEYAVNLAFDAGSNFKISIYSKDRQKDVDVIGGNIGTTYTNDFKTRFITKFFQVINKVKAGKTPEIILGDLQMERLLETLPGD